MSKITEAQEILKEMGLPIPQQNGNVGIDFTCSVRY